MPKHRWAVVVLIVVLHASAAAQNPAGQLGPREKWIVLASRESLADAVEFARRASSVRNDVRIFKAVNNWYTVLFGPITSDAAIGIKDELVAQGRIPTDAYVAGGRRFVEDVTHTLKATTPTVRAREETADTRTNNGTMSSEMKEMPCLSDLTRRQDRCFTISRENIACAQNHYQLPRTYLSDYYHTVSSAGACFQDW